MTTTEKILALIKEKQLSEYSVTKATALSENSVAGWRKGRAKPSADAVAKLAHYFGVTTDYLLGLTDNPTPPLDNGNRELPLQLSKDEQELLNMYRQLEKDKKKSIVDITSAYYATRTIKV